MQPDTIRPSPIPADTEPLSRGSSLQQDARPRQRFRHRRLPRCAARAGRRGDPPLGDRHFGVGFDQLLTIEPRARSDCAFAYGIWNTDGSRAGQCGNGVRCVARWLVRAGALGARRGGAPAKVRPGRSRSNCSPTVACASTWASRVSRRPRFRSWPMKRMIATGSTSPAARSRWARFRWAIRMRWSRSTMSTDGAGRGARAADRARRRVSGALQRRFRRSVRSRKRDRSARLGARRRRNARLRQRRMRGGRGAARARQARRRSRVALPGGTLEIGWTGPGATLWMTGPAAFVFEGEWHG